MTNPQPQPIPAPIIRAMTPTIWQGCYSGSWQNIITPEAFAHPAKVAPLLAHRIYRHMLDCGWIAPGDRIVDPFGGIGGFGYHAMALGLHFTGVELEPRFVELAAANVAKWQRDLAMLDGLGTAQVLQGDSRRLAEVVGDAAAVVSSPPFGEGETRNRSDYAPGYVADMMSRAYTQDRQGTTTGNLAALRANAGDFAAAVSSPPYADAVNGSGEGPGARHDPIYHNGDNAYKQSSANGYGNARGNLGNLAGDGWDAAVSSPRFEDSDNRGAVAMPEGYFVRKNGKPFGEGVSVRSVLGDTPGNIGNDTGETFWSAARLIVEQTHAVLKPGGHTAWVCKDFVRKGERVPFSDQWEQLCAAVGFVPVERIHAMLVEDYGTQLGMFGEDKARRKERKSFFRRLSERNGSPRIDYEDVIIMRKPL